MSEVFLSWGGGREWRTLGFLFPRWRTLRFNLFKRCILEQNVTNALSFHVSRQL